jgi:hypothetical protein
VDPVTCEGKGNERADHLAGDAMDNGIEWYAPVRPSDFPLTRGTPIRDILGGRDWRSLRACCSFFRRSNLKTGADWPYNEVGKIPRGPSSWGPLRQSGGPPASCPFFVF